MRELSRHEFRTREVGSKADRRLRPTEAPTVKRIRIIINASAGSGRARMVVQSAVQDLWGWEPEFFFPASIDETRELCRNANPEQTAAIVLAGGDGTFNQALPGLIGTKIPVATFPCGTANDLAAELGLTADWKHLGALLATSQVRPLDLIRVNDRYFATVGGLGLGTELVTRVNDLRARSPVFQALWSRMKSEMYGLMAANLIISGRSGVTRMIIRADNFQRTLPVSSIFVANQSTLGGDIVVAPRAATNDGKFDVVVLSLGNRVELLRSMIGARLGQGFPGNHRFATRRLRVELLSNHPVSVFGDGELLVTSRIFDFEILPSALTMVSPNRDFALLAQRLPLAPSLRRAADSFHREGAQP